MYMKDSISDILLASVCLGQSAWMLASHLCAVAGMPHVRCGGHLSSDAGHSLLLKVLASTV